jgi:predicted RNA-binding protein YlqC (UPF0109 family)
MRKNSTCEWLFVNITNRRIEKVIGKQGRTAQAMRTLIGAVSSKLKKRTVLEILD